MTPESLAGLSPEVLRHLPGTKSLRRERAGAGREQEELLEAGFNTPYPSLIPSSQAQVMYVSGEVAMA